MKQRKICNKENMFSKTISRIVSRVDNLASRWLQFRSRKEQRESMDLINKLYQKMFRKVDKLTEVRDMVNHKHTTPERFVSVEDGPYEFQLTTHAKKGRSKVVFTLLRNDNKPLTHIQTSLFKGFATWCIEGYKIAIHERPETSEDKLVTDFLKREIAKDILEEMHGRNVQSDTYAVELYLDLVSELKLAPLIINDDASIVVI